MQVPAIAPLGGPIADYARKRAIDMARGDAAAIPQGVDPWPNMAGTPHLATLAHFSPLGQVERLRIPTLIRDAGDGGDVPDRGQRRAGRARSSERFPGGDVDYEVIPGITTTASTSTATSTGSQDALAWLERHL